MPDTVPSIEEHASLAAQVGVIDQRLILVEEKLKLPNNGNSFDLKLAWEMSPENFPDIQAFIANCLGYDFPWGRINGELQRYVAYNNENLKINNNRVRLICTRTGVIEPVYGTFNSTNLIFKRQVPMDRPWQLDFNLKMPKGVGFWPAAWLYPVTQTATSNSEIDTVESIYNNRDKSRDHRGKIFQGFIGRILGTHFSKQDKWGASHLSFDTSDAFHVYSTRWKPSSVLEYGGLITQLVDGEVVEIQEVVWDGPNPNIILNLACCSDLSQVDWPGTAIQGRPDCILPEDFELERNCLDCRWIRLFT